MIDGKPYLVPWDWGYSTPMYRGDKYVPSSQSWEAILFDKKLKNKVTMYDEGVAIIKIGGLINGHQNVNTLTQKQINQSRDTMIKAKANIVSFWQSETQAMQDFISGKVWVTYAWPDTFAQVVAKPSMKNAKVVYMQPKEGHAGLDLRVRDRGRAEERGPGLRLPQHRLHARRRWTTSSTRSSRAARP